MSDSRFHLKVEFEIYGQKYKWEPSFNYFDRGDGMDERIHDWFVKCYQDAHGKYQAAMYEEQREQEKREAEQRERVELARLRAKYPDA